jgi:hypothetical protein
MMEVLGCQAAGCDGEATQCESDSGSTVEPKRSGAHSSPIVADESTLMRAPKKTRIEWMRVDDDKYFFG